jgi:hypothetical protein
MIFFFARVRSIPASSGPHASAPFRPTSRLAAGQFPAENRRRDVWRAPHAPRRKGVTPRRPIASGLTTGGYGSSIGCKFAFLKDPLSALQIGEIALKCFGPQGLMCPHQRTTSAKRRGKPLTTNGLLARATQLAGASEVMPTLPGRESSKLLFVAVTIVIVPTYKPTVAPVRHGDVATTTPTQRIAWSCHR